MNDLPAGWGWATLYDVASWGSGGTPKRSKPEYFDGGIPWAVIGDLNDCIVRSTAQTISEAGLASSSAKLVPEGAVLLAMYGSIGKLGMAGMEMATNQAIAFARVDDNVMSADFLFHYLRSQRPALNSVGQGATQKNISQTVLRGWPVPVPPRLEQDRIVAAIEEHLSRLDAAAEALRSAEVRIEAMSAGLAMELTAGSKVQWVALGEIAEVKGGVTKDARRQSDPAFVDVPYLRVANVQRGYLDLDVVTTIRVDPQKAAALELRKGDLLLNEGGDRDKLGRGWVWEGQIDRCIHQNHVFRARLTDDGFNPYFVSRHANTWGRSWFEQHGKQTTNLASISLTTLKQLPVPVLPRARQDEMVARLSEIDSVTARLSAALRDGDRRATALRRSILAAAFSGRLVPQDPADEPASVLLERIRAEAASSKADKRHRAGTAAR